MLQPLQPAPEGVQSTKARRAAVQRVERDPQIEARASAAALGEIADEAMARSGLAFFLHPHMESSKATKRFKRMHLMYHLGKDYIELDISSDDEGWPSHWKTGGSARKHALSAGTAAGAPVPSDDDQPSRERTFVDLDAFYYDDLSIPSRPVSPIPEIRIIIADEEERESVTPDDVRESIWKAQRPNKTPSTTPSDVDLV